MLFNRFITFHISNMEFFFKQAKKYSWLMFCRMLCAQNVRDCLDHVFLWVLCIIWLLICFVIQISFTKKFDQELTTNWVQISVYLLFFHVSARRDMRCAFVNTYSVWMWNIFMSLEKLISCSAINFLRFRILIMDFLNLDLICCWPCTVEHHRCARTAIAIKLYHEY